jgi:hypothetical protein
MCIPGFGEFPGNCGILVIYELPTGIGPFLEAWKLDPKWAYNETVKMDLKPIVTFSDTCNGKRGRRIFAALKTKDPQGKFHKSPRVKNPETGNYIELFYWIPSEAFKRKTHNIETNKK